MVAKKKPEDKAIRSSVSFDPEQFKELCIYCQREERSISWVVRKAVAEWLEKQKEITRP